MKKRSEEGGFASLGFASLNIDRALQELEASLYTQSEEGYIPHIGFYNDTLEDEIDE